MGLNSGEVVVGAIGDDLRMDYTAHGHTVGLAQRMEQLAEPGTGLPDRAHGGARRPGYFALEDLGEFDVKGVARAAARLRAARRRAARTRLDVAPRARLLALRRPRRRRWRTLEAALERALAGEGQVVGIVGEPGVGKSRLCHEFAAALPGARHRRSYDGARPSRTASRVPLAARARAAARATSGSATGTPTTAAREKIAGKLARCSTARFGDDAAAAVRLPRRRRSRSARRRAMDPDARAAQLFAVDQTPRSTRASRREPGRHPDRGPALARRGERGVPRQPRRGGARARARSAGRQLPARVPGPAG